MMVLRTRIRCVNPMCVAVCLMAVMWLLPLPAPAEGSSVSDADDALAVQVFYATNRERFEGRSADETYGGGRGEPHYGHCGVEFTPIPLLNGFAGKVPFYVPGETNEIRLAEQADPQAFWERLSTAVSESVTGSVVVFVHGYNYGFDRTCRMAAELQRSLADGGTVLMFSWPSDADPAQYVSDQADVEWSVPFLADLLVELGERIGPANIRLLAHSLGSRGTIFALKRVAADVSIRPVIGELVFLAPDFDSQTFVEFLPRLIPLVEGISLYASSKDAPLKVSRQLSGYPRLGEAGEFLTVVMGMETVDVSGSGRYQLLGHEYFYYHPLVKADLVELLTSGKRAAARRGLRVRTRDGQHYWEVKDPGEG